MSYTLDGQDYDTLQDIYDAGYSDGDQDGYDRGWDDGFETGQDRASCDCE